jgi:hypothetical protein
MFGHSRRNFLRGATVCLALPYLESLAPRKRARAADAPVRRIICTYFPNGAAASFWPVKNPGQGDQWALSPVLAPFAPLKKKMNVFTNLENYSCMLDNPDVEPSHARFTGAYMTCADSDRLRQDMKVDIANGVSVDQVIARSMTTPLKSLELGLSTLDSYTDGRDPSLSRSVAWRTQTEPLYKEVNPQAVFDRLVSAGAVDGSGQLSGDAVADAKRRQLLKLSALDFVLDSAKSLNGKLGSSDKAKLDQFLTSVRELEERVRNFNVNAVAALQCDVIDRPPQAYSLNVSDGYNRGTHNDIMNQLIVMALRCDVTRVVSYMLDDARSDFVYDHLIERKFTDAGSTPGDGGKVSGYHGLQHAGDSNNGYASINYSLCDYTSQLCQMLDKIPDGEGTMLDSTVLFMGSGMRGSDHNGNKLPMLMVGGGAAGLKQDQSIVFPETPNDRPLRDLYFTLLNKFFDLKVPSFGESVFNRQNALIEELLA